jgi:hypothetical protein
LIARGEGPSAGPAAVRGWEREMAGRSLTRALVSTQAGGAAHGFWRRIGYADCGSLDLPGRQAERLMFRDISAAAAEPLYGLDHLTKNNESGADPG